MKTQKQVSLIADQIREAVCQSENSNVRLLISPGSHGANAQIIADIRPWPFPFIPDLGGMQVIFVCQVDLADDREDVEASVRKACSKVQGEVADRVQVVDHT